MSEEPTWEVCRKLVGCPIISRLILGRCLSNMVRVSPGTNQLAMDRDQLIGQHTLFIWNHDQTCWAGAPAP